MVMGLTSRGVVSPRGLSSHCPPWRGGSSGATPYSWPANSKIFVPCISLPQSVGSGVGSPRAGDAASNPGKRAGSAISDGECGPSLPEPASCPPSLSVASPRSLPLSLGSSARCSPNRPSLARQSPAKLTVLFTALSSSLLYADVAVPQTSFASILRLARASSSSFFIIFAISCIICLSTSFFTTEDSELENLRPGEAFGLPPCRPLVLSWNCSNLLFLSTLGNLSSLI
mmetsp:Transcript_8937/g.26840  ORF Transcript_8937/g.26840 Transcript_8937/m.26840 type:complete len:229 (+) Transcript_8937:199-885(+)